MIFELNGKTIDEKQAREHLGDYYVDSMIELEADKNRKQNQQNELEDKERKNEQCYMKASTWVDSARDEISKKYAEFIESLKTSIEKDMCSKIEIDRYGSGRALVNLLLSECIEYRHNNKVGYKHKKKDVRKLLLNTYGLTDSFDPFGEDIPDYYC
jgi:arginyl-tRNA synthetase